MNYNEFLNSKTGAGTLQLAQPGSNRLQLAGTGSNRHRRTAPNRDSGTAPASIRAFVDASRDCPEGLHVSRHQLDRSSAVRVKSVGVSVDHGGEGRYKK